MNNQNHPTKTTILTLLLTLTLVFTSSCKAIDNLLHTDVFKELVNENSKEHTNYQNSFTTHTKQETETDKFTEFVTEYTTESITEFITETTTTTQTELETQITTEITTTKPETETETETEPPKETTTTPDPQEQYLIGYFELTAYCSCVLCCGHWAQNRPTDQYGNPIIITASGEVAKAGVTIAADTNLFPFGTELIIFGNTYIVQDRGGAIVGNKIDVYFDDHGEALEFGRQFGVEVYGIIGNS